VLLSNDEIKCTAEKGFHFEARILCENRVFFSSGFSGASLEEMRMACNCGRNFLQSAVCGGHINVINLAFSSSFFAVKCIQPIIQPVKRLCSNV
jgi:hypothetical protein